MTIDSLIPKFLKRIDAYLLKNYPNLWITNVHFALFYVIVLNVLLYAATAASGYFLTDPIPDVETPFALMILPAVLVFVFWFIKQARYNVDKNFGKSKLVHDYQNFFVYILVIGLFYSVSAIIPHTLISNVKNAISLEELNEDINTLDHGYPFFDSGHLSVSEKDSSKIHIQNSPKFIYTDYYYDFVDEDRGRRQTTIDRRQALIEIEAFITTYNKYTDQKIDLTPQHVLELSLTNQEVLYNNYYWNYTRPVDWKIERIQRIHRNRLEFSLYNPVYLKAIFVIIGVLAMLTWIFKNVHWKNFLSAGITIILSPFIMGVVALILYGLIRLDNYHEELGIVTVILFFNLISVLWFLIPYLKGKYSYMSVINGILLQLWSPFSIFVYSFIFMRLNRRRYYYDSYYYGYTESDRFWDNYLESTYWIAWAVALISIPLMKRFYKRMWATPKNK